MKREYFASHVSDKGLLSKICKELILNSKKDDLTVKWVKDLCSHFSKEAL